MSKRHKYLVADTDLFTVDSHVEECVLECLRIALEECGAKEEVDEETIRDAYAYALNQLPVLYPHRGVDKPDDLIRAWNIHAVVEHALKHVMTYPKK